MSDCLFCKIVQGEIPCEKVYEDENVLAFNDINPEAPIHFLVIPKKHIATINDTSSEDQAILGQLMLAAKNIAKEKDIADSGFRTVMNCGDDGCQTVQHIHLHVLGGRSLQWPPG